MGNTKQLVVLIPWLCWTSKDHVQHGCTKRKTILFFFGGWSSYVKVSHLKLVISSVIHRVYLLSQLNSIQNIEGHHLQQILISSDVQNQQEQDMYPSDFSFSLQFVPLSSCLCSTGSWTSCMINKHFANGIKALDMFKISYSIISQIKPSSLQNRHRHHHHHHHHHHPQQLIMFIMSIKFIRKTH